MVPVPVQVLSKRLEGVSSGEVSFSETPYGIVKRIEVILGWVQQFTERTGKTCLSILDYGCGTGDHVTYPLALVGHEVLGVDLHEPSIFEARQNYVLPNLSFRTGQLEDLAKEHLTFDLIVCSEVVEHLHTPLDSLLVISRLLRPRGALIITTPNGFGSYEMLCRFERQLRRIGLHQALRWLFHEGRHLVHRAHDLTATSHPPDHALEDQNPGFLNWESTHIQFFSLKALEALFRSSGFHVVSRRARTFLCGPYIDVLFRIGPFPQTLFRLNNRLADILPFTWAADWMFLLEREEYIQS